MRWCELTLTRDGGVLARVVLQGPGTPDLGAVDEVARWLLRAARVGAAIRVDDCSPEMGDLLELAGLAVEMRREAVGREEPIGIHEREEEVHPHDPAG